MSLKLKNKKIMLVLLLFMPVVIYLSTTYIFAFQFSFETIVGDSEIERHFMVNTSTKHLFESNEKHKLNAWRLLSQCILDGNNIKSNCNSTNFHKHQLLYDTLQYLQDINMTSDDFKYHDIIAMRRHIIIQCMLNNISASQIYIQLLRTFAQLEQYHNALKTKNKYKIFHMHFSKSAGTSVKATLRKMTSLKNDVADVFNIDCFALYHKYNYSAYSRENALFPGFGANNEPLLCDNFIYIVPIREPIERICSQTSQLATGMQHFLRRIEKNNNKRYKRGVEIDGIQFVYVSKLSDLHHLYTELLLSENNEIYKRYKVDSFETVKHRIYALSLPQEEVEADGFQLGSKSTEPVRYFPFNISLDEKNHLKFNNTTFVLESSRFAEEKWGGYQDVAWLRTKMGSNIYTSYLGYNESNRNHSNYLVLANYIARTQINYGHFINAVNAMFAFDHVLPMDLYSNLSQTSYSNTGIIWDICLQEIQSHLRPNDAKLAKWEIKNSNSGLRAKMIFSKGVCKSLTTEDRNILLKYNKFDMRLYGISRMIEKADVEFHQFKVKYNV